MGPQRNDYYRKRNQMGAEEKQEEINIDRPVKSSYLDKIRTSWDNFAYKSSYGSIIIRILSTIVIFISVFLSVKYAENINGSIVCSFIEWLSKYTENTAIVILGIELFVSIIWFFNSELGTVFVALIMFASYAGFSPLVMMVVSLLLVFFAGEDRPVIAMMTVLQAATFLTSIKAGIMLAAVAAFVSLRKNDGPVKVLGFVYCSLLELCNGSFGIITNSSGEQIIPKIQGNTVAIEDIKTVFSELAQGEYQKDVFFIQVLILIVVYLVIGIIFASMINERYSKGKLNIDIKDAIIYIVLFAMLCLAQVIISTFTVMKTLTYSFLPTGLQILFAYLLTRPIAGRSQRRSNPVFSEGNGFVFISYAHTDLDRVKPYLKLLNKKGYDFWYDDSIKTGTEWQEVIASNLANSSCFIAFISSNSIKSEYCLKEINYATSKKKPTAVIMIDNVGLPPVLEMHLASLQAVKRSQFASDEECLDKVLEMEEFEKCKYKKEVRICP